METILVAARYLGLEVQRADGSRRFTGHALRVGGAQSLSRAGFDAWAIALLARHSSQAVLGYIRGTPLLASAWMAPRAAIAFANSATTQVVADRVHTRQGRTRAGISKAQLVAACRATWQQEMGAHADMNKAFGALDAQLSDVNARVTTLSGLIVSQLNEMESSWLRRLAEIKQKAEDLARLPDDALFVTNRSRGAVHLIAEGDVRTQSASWHTLCGWRFGRSDVRRCDVLPSDHRQICEKCLPDVRRRLKARFAASAAHAAGHTAGAEASSSAPRPSDAPS